MKRWTLLENNTALLSPGWLPPGGDWPELADLRAEHERLLVASVEASRAVAEVKRRHEAEDEQRGEAIKQAVLAGEDPAATNGTAADERSAERAEAMLRYEAATDALVEFLAKAIAQIKEQASELYAALESRRAEAEAKRQEAQRLLAEAEQLVVGVERKQHWLDRISGQSALGHFPYEQMTVPTPPRQPEWAQVMGGAQTMEVEHV
jgi:hypothetical protein